MPYFTQRPVNLRGEIISDAGEWARHRPSIEQLLRTCHLVTPHSSTSWLSDWWGSYGSGHELRVGLFWRDTLLVGYAPLMVSRETFLGVPGRVMRFVGDGISDYADLFSRDDDPVVKAQMVDAILRDWRWDELNLANVREGSTTIAAFEQLRSSRYFVRVRADEVCPYIDLRGVSFEQYYRGLSRNHRRELQKRRHKLDALGTWTLDFNRGRPALFDAFRRLHSSRSASMGWSSVYDLPGFREHFTRMMEHQDPDFEVLCSTLYAGSALISYTLGFVRDRVYHHWNIGFDQAYEDIAPNKLHHQFLIEECFRRGYVEFDFMRGGYEYKFKWTDTARRNYGIRLLKRRGWRRAISRVHWLQEREQGSMLDRCVTTVRAFPSLLHLIGNRAAILQDR